MNWIDTYGPQRSVITSNVITSTNNKIWEIKPQNIIDPSATIKNGCLKTDHYHRDCWDSSFSIFGNPGIIRKREDSSVKDSIKALNELKI